MGVLDGVKEVLRDVLQLGDRAQAFDEDTLLFGSLPELDSMAVASLMVALEERFDFIMEEDEVSAETFESVGSLSRFIQSKIET
jgi:acyl carrier protein